MRISFLTTVYLSALVSTSAAAETHNPVLEQYLDVYMNKSTSGLVLSEQATFYGALLSEPIVGREQIIAFLDRVLPSVELLEVKQVFEDAEGGCAELVFRIDGVRAEEAHCLRIDQQAVSGIRLYYDPRPLLAE